MKIEQELIEGKLFELISTTPLTELTSDEREFVDTHLGFAAYEQQHLTFGQLTSIEENTTRKAPSLVADALFDQKVSKRIEVTSWFFQRSGSWALVSCLLVVVWFASKYTYSPTMPETIEETSSHNLLTDTSTTQPLVVVPKIDSVVMEESKKAAETAELLQANKAPLSEKIPQVTLHWREERSANGVTVSESPYTKFITPF